ncbi:MAG: response regulator, partial [Chitinophagaceae bacterium]|nr:response regulator [Chitinophagaceae bacterium]
NAIKFTDKGYVALDVSLLSTTNNKFTVRFDITDTGIGIDEEYRKQMFESFTQASSDTTRRFGGTGLGLAISKQLTELMKGSISVSSELGKGSCFTVQIPFAKALKKENHHKKEADKNLGALLSKAYVLLAEDNEFNQLVAIDTLKSLAPGIRIDVAENGAEAVEKIKANNYDLVLMDIRMPVMDGMEATKIVRAMEGPKSRTKIIAMTANVMAEDVRTYFQIGMDAYVSKPFEQGELLNKMATLLGASPVPATEEKQAPQKQQRSIPDKVTDMNFLQQFTSKDVAKQDKYIRMFLDNAPKLLAQLHEGLNKQDFGMIKIAAHSLKPQLSYMGVSEDVSNVFMLEQSAGETAHYQWVPELVAHVEKVCHKAFAELKEYMQR